MYVTYKYVEQSKSEIVALLLVRLKRRCKKIQIYSCGSIKSYYLDNSIRYLVRFSNVYQ